MSTPTCVYCVILDVEHEFACLREVTASYDSARKFVEQETALHAEDWKVDSSEDGLPMEWVKGTAHWIIEEWQVTP